MRISVKSWISLSISAPPPISVRYCTDIRRESVNTRRESVDIRAKTVARIVQFGMPQGTFIVQSNDMYVILDTMQPKFDPFG